MGLNDSYNSNSHRGKKQHESKLKAVLESIQEHLKNVDCKKDFCSCFNCCKCSKYKNICMHGQCSSCGSCYCYLTPPCLMNTFSQSGSNGETIQLNPTLNTGPTFITGPNIDASPTLDTGPNILTGPILDAGPNVITGPNLDAGPTIDTGTNIIASPTVDTGTAISTGTNITASPTIDTGTAISTGTNITASPTVDTGTAISTGTNITASPTVDTGTAINTGTNITASPTVDTGATISDRPIGLNTSQGSYEYAYIFNLDSQTIEAGSNINFSINGTVTKGFVHKPGTDLIYISNTGIYLINFYITGNKTNQFTLYQKDNPVLDSTYISLADLQLGIGFITASAGDFLYIKNHSGNATIPQQTTSYESKINAFIFIQKIN